MNVVRIISTLLFFMILFQGCGEGDDNLTFNHFYWVGDEKIPLDINHQMQYIVIDDIYSKDELYQLVNPYTFCKIQEIYLFNSIINDTVLVKNNTHFATIRSTCSSAIRKHPKLRYIAPFFKYRGLDVALGHSFTVQLKTAADYDVLDSMATTHNVRIFRNLRRPLFYVLACTKENDRNALEMANDFYETGLFQSSEPDLFLHEGTSD